MRRNLGSAAVVALALAMVSIEAAAQGAGQAAPPTKAQSQAKVKEQAKEQAKEKAKEKVKEADKAGMQKRKDKAEESSEVRDAKVVVQGVFRAGDREAFQRYFATHNMRAKPLPPGMAKRLAKGKPLPPGIAKQVMPADLLKIAPPLPRDAEYGIFGDAVVVSKAGVVLDILAGVLK